DFPSCCPTFTGGSGAGFQFGGWMNRPLSTSLSVMGRLMISYDAVGFLYDERTFVADVRDTPRVVPSIFRHELSAKQAHIVLEPLLAIGISSRGRFMIGPRIGVPVSSTFEQTETLAEPVDFGSFLNTGRVWISNSGDIPSTPLASVAMTGALGWTFPLNASQSVHMMPEVSFSYALTPVSQGADWYPHAVRLSIGIGWSAPSEVKALPLPPPTSAPEMPAIVFDTTGRNGPTPPEISLEILGVNDDGTTTRNPMINRREIFVRTLHPMLGNVYFSEGSSLIPQRYLDGIARALRDTLSLTPLEALHGELFIIASRIRMRPKARLRIGGMTANTLKDQGADLARRRAEAVRTKLIELGVDSTRIDLVTGPSLFPATKSSDSSQKPLAIEENQRVEVSCTDFAVMAPITVGTTDVSVWPRRIRIVDTIASPALSTVQSEVIVGESRVSFPREMASTMSADEIDLSSLVAPSSSSSSLEVRVSATDSSGLKATKKVTVPIRQQSMAKWRAERSGDVLIERYGLVLFDFNNSGLGLQHRQIIDIIRSRLTPQTTVSIIGMTDIMGSDEYNRDLSLRRAREVARALGVSSATIDGQGETVPQFPNQLPEGRASNRTVIIELKTKVP
ncbi:MAG: OmpA family protein, partial [Candidatus Kapaibacterium sp.]